MDNDILSALEASNKAFADFRGMMERRIDSLERTDAKMYNRPGNGGVEPGGSSRKSLELNTPEIKAFTRYVKTGDESELKALDITNAAEGGYGVPKVIDSIIEELLLLQSPIRRYATVKQISTSDYHQLVNLRGTASGWAGETTARTETATPTLADVVPPMGELYANPMATQQMLDDVFFNAEQWIGQNLADEFGRAESDAFINGNGTTKPKGMLTYATAATGDATRAFGTVQYLPTGAAGGLNATNPLDVLQSIIYSLKPGYREGGGAVWLMNSNTLAAISTLKDTLGRFLLVPSLAAGRPPTLLGYEVVEAQHMPDIAANALPIAFGNLRRAYLIVDRMGPRVLRDPFTNKPYIGFYSTKRTGGAIMNSEALKFVKCSVS